MANPENKQLTAEWTNITNLINNPETKIEIIFNRDGAAFDYKMVVIGDLRKRMIESLKCDRRVIQERITALEENKI